MSLTERSSLIASMLLVAVAAGCAAPKVPDPSLLAPREEQEKLRSMQSRTFDAPSTSHAMRVVIATLQDLGFIVERANDQMGLVSASRFAQPSYTDVLAVTVTVKAKGTGKVLIRANAIFNNEPISDPKIYQNFFATIERSMFLGRN